ncbi:MAG: hypothetical protein WKG06_31050 [Segetibacter sp.]
MGGIIFLPYIGAWIHYKGKFPVDYFAFPALTAPPKAGFNLTIFTLIAITFAAVILLYAFPAIFGFKKNTITIKKEMKKVALPVWF